MTTERNADELFILDCGQTFFALGSSERLDVTFDADIPGGLRSPYHYPIRKFVERWGMVLWRSEPSMVAGQWWQVYVHPRIRLGDYLEAPPLISAADITDEQRRQIDDRLAVDRREYGAMLDQAAAMLEEYNRRQQGEAGA